MKIPNSLVAILSCLPFISAAQASANRSSACSSYGQVRALYTMNNAPDGNFVISASIGPDGKLTLGNVVSAQGLGGFPNISGGDPLSSQDSMTVDVDRLYVVNAGSNTVATFTINMLNPTELTIVGEPVSTKGDFPVSVAVSPRTGQVCVLNGGTVDPASVNGVNCYKPDALKGLVEIPDTNRSLNQNITFSPIGLLNAPSQVTWSSDGTVLYAVVKGDPPSDPGFIASWTVNLETGALSENFTRSLTPFNGGLPFSMTPVPDTTGFVVSDVINGYDIFSFPISSAVGLSAGFQIPGQEAACWGRRSRKTGNIYIGDFGNGVVTEIHVDKNLQPTIINQYSLGKTVGINEESIGTIDGHDFLYVLEGAVNKISVLSLEAPGVAPVIQALDLSPIAKANITLDGNFTAGLAIYNP